MENKWVVEGFLGHNADSLQRLPLLHFPAVIGRDSSLVLCISNSQVSRKHAELVLLQGQLVLRDLGSTNGTFVNRKRLTAPQPICHGDVVHFGNVEVRFLNEAAEQEAEESDSTVFCDLPLTNRLPSGLGDLQKLLEERAVRAEFQPIVKVDGSLYGYEVLGRGSRADLASSPGELFHIAESVSGKATQLSEIMRDCGIRLGAEQSPRSKLFVNTHPEELRQIGRLLSSLEQLRQNHPDTRVVLEIHEDAVTDIKQLLALAADLRSLNIEIAYDDFGAGQSRLQELIDVPVAYVKFDVTLIRGLDKAPKSKQDMVAALVSMTRSLGITALAEGVEYRSELDICAAMNFDLAQGYYFGRPAPAMAYTNPLL